MRPHHRTYLDRNFNVRWSLPQRTPTGPAVREVKLWKQVYVSKNRFSLEITFLSI